MMATWRVHLLGECPTWEDKRRASERRALALDSMGLLGFLFGGLELARGRLGCKSFLARGC
jgi:hypothetical protein